MYTIRGYIIKDDAGIIAITPLFEKTILGQQMALDYIRKHTVLEILSMNENEDEIDFKIRLTAKVEYWKERKKQELN